MASRRKKPAAVEPEVPIEEITDYVVTNCQRVNFRSGPSKDTSVIAVITRGTRVVVDLNEKLDDWFKVHVEHYGDGYIMKDYLAPIT